MPTIRESLPRFHVSLAVETEIQRVAAGRLTEALWQLERDEISDLDEAWALLESWTTDEAVIAAFPAGDRESLAQQYGDHFTSGERPSSPAQVEALARLAFDFLVAAEARQVLADVEALLERMGLCVEAVTTCRPIGCTTDRFRDEHGWTVGECRQADGADFDVDLYEYVSDSVRLFVEAALGCRPQESDTSKTSDAA
ncbi:MAG: hypothetical protein AAGC60_23530 [Acidobacteriota bacterium]